MKDEGREMEAELFLQPPGVIPIPLLGDADGQLYGVSAGITRVGAIQPNLIGGSYPVGTCIGGVFAINGAARSVGLGSGIIYGATIVDPARNVAPIDLLYFNAAPVSGFTDRLEGVIAAADALKVLGHSQVNTFATYGTAAGCSVGTSINENIQFQLGKTGATVNTTLYVAPISRGALTLAVGVGWTVNFKIMPD